MAGCGLYDASVEVVLAAVSRAGVVVGVGSWVQRGVLVVAGGSSGPSSDASSCASDRPCTVGIVVVVVVVAAAVFVAAAATASVVVVAAVSVVGAAAVVVGVAAAMVAGRCEGTGVVPVDAGVRGAGVEERVWAGEGVGSLVRKQRSLRVSLGALATGAGGRSRCDCWKLDSTPLDSSDEVSLPSGVESESNICRGERRLRVREAWSSCSPSTLGLGLFFESPSALNLMSGSPV